MPGVIDHVQTTLTYWFWRHLFAPAAWVGSSGQILCSNIVGTCNIASDETLQKYHLMLHQNVSFNGQRFFLFFLMLHSGVNFIILIFKDFHDSHSTQTSGSVPISLTAWYISQKKQMDQIKPNSRACYKCIYWSVSYCFFAWCWDCKSLSDWVRYANRCGLTQILMCIFLGLTNWFELN